MIKFFLFLYFLPFFVGEMGLPLDLEEETQSVFRNIVVTGNNGDYVVTGEAKTKVGTFFYTVEDGHNQFVDETKVIIPQMSLDWGRFEIPIKISNDKLPNNATLILNLYERDSGGNIKNTNPVVLEKFYK